MSSATHMTLLTKIGFLCGWMCFGLAFIAAAAESSLGSSFITSTNDLLLAAVPGKWIAFKARYASFLFDNVVLSIMHLPGWLIAGLPAGFLLWSCRPHREDMDPELLSSLMTFDRLAEMAEEEGALDDDPSFTQLNIDDYDAEHRREDVKTAKEYMDDWEPEAVEKEPQSPLSPYEKMDKSREGLPIPFDKLS